MIDNKLRGKCGRESSRSNPILLVFKLTLLLLGLSAGNVRWLHCKHSAIGCRVLLVVALRASAAVAQGEATCRTICAHPRPTRQFRAASRRAADQKVSAS